MITALKKEQKELKAELMKKNSVRWDRQGKTQSLAKKNEAMNVQKTYEKLAKQLREDLSAQKKQLKAMEETSRAKKLNILQLKQLAHDAQLAKEQAKQEFQRVKEEVERERSERHRDLEEQRSQYRAVQDVRGALRERHHSKLANEAGSEGANQVHAQQLLEKMRAVVAVEDPADVMDRVVAQRMAHDSLVEKERECKGKELELSKNLDYFKLHLGELRSAGSNARGSGGMVDRAEAELRAVTDECNNARDASEAMARTVVEAVAGLQHIVHALTGIPSQVPPLPVAPETLVEVTCQCGDRLEWAQKQI
ncbi:unnamed protein product [Ostreobium quekettii]|uniref:Uncharacterized protein n=1 Tax=Ostreobium quekettii TaxID=121088 RepID=A0A8S1J6E5_9CHLO|nr:unnamed protein product [Ostreobium quekettii]